MIDDEEEEESAANDDNNASDTLATDSMCAPHVHRYFVSPFKTGTTFEEVCYTAFNSAFP